MVQEYLLIEQSQRMMATDVSIHLAVPPAQESEARQALEAGMRWMREVERRLTRFDAQSELSQLNQAAGQWRHVSELLFLAVREAVAAAEASAGLFDPTLLALLEALGYDRDFSQLARQAGEGPAAGLTPPAPGGNWQGIEFETKRRRIRLPRGARLDLGGIAKGWAADQALKHLFQPFTNVIINVGGDLRLRGGPQPGQHWAVGIRDPQRDYLPQTADNVAIVSFARGGLATSGATRRWWYQGERRQHHLLDPRTGQPAQLWLPTVAGSQEAAGESSLIATATALAPTAARAEVAAKVALLRGYPAALQAVEDAWGARQNGAAHLRADDRVALLLVLGNGQVILSQNMNDYLETAKGGAIWA